MERKRKQILLRSETHQPLGKIIVYLQSLPFDPKELARQTLEARFLPLCIDKSAPNSIGIALQCLGMLEGYAQTIRQFYGLGTPVLSANDPQNLTDAEALIKTPSEGSTEFPQNQRRESSTIAQMFGNKS